MSIGFTKCISHLNSKGFLHLHHKSDKIKELATYGIIFKSNLKRCLDDYYRMVDKFVVFPVSCASDLMDLRNQFHDKSLGKFAANFDSIDDIGLISEPNNDLDLWSTPRSTKNLVILCDPSQSLNLFYSFQNERYRWWRKLSGSPSNFFQSPIGKCKLTNEENVTIYFKSNLMEDKKLCLENLKYLTDSDQIKNLFGLESYQHVIWSRIFPDNGTISYLIDGCSTDDSGDFKEMWFHESLTPYHVVITIKSSTESHVHTKLNDIADYLMKEMKNCGITVFPFKHYYSPYDDSPFKLFEGIGIPYAINISEESLQLGVVGLHNKDTKLEESVHITRVKINLLLYLKLMKPLDIKLAIMEGTKVTNPI